LRWGISMKDNIGNDIHVDDLVFCYSGQYKNKIQRVTGFRMCNGNSLNWITEAVNFEGNGWVSALNVVSLNALGVDVTSLTDLKTIKGCDALGNTLSIGDKVLFLHAKEMYAEEGIINSMTEKSCLLTIELNRFGQTEYRKKYNELISLTALGIEKIPKRNWRGDVIG